MTPGLANRRSHERLDVVGDLQGAFGTEPLLRIWNIGLGGALVEADQALPLMAVYQARLAIKNDRADVHVRIRHVRRSEGSLTRYLIGVEFLGLSPAALSIVQRLMVVASGDASSPG